MLRAIKIIMFHILLSSRGLILAISKFLSFAFIFAFVMTMTIDKLSDMPLSAKASMVFLGVTFTLIFWFYDYLIFYLKPKIIDIMLIK